ncbi:GNAT family N-acetyltransferase [Massilia sp. CCM 8734]|nr:GNAT family N-acetyltransferase [Massilia sp. CCM 8734]NHZ96957.1 GNAT family N-acetyltransferase [Massilia sp. CCM 8734]
MGIEIRTAVPDDAFAACDVLRRSISECCVADHRNDPDLLKAWLGNKTPQNVASWFVSPANHVLIAERDGVVVGVALLTQAGKLSLCYVLPEALYSGVGKALLQGVEAQARAWGVSVLRLNSTLTASKFYERNGYILAGKEMSCYGLECDFFWKKLNATDACDPAPKKRFCHCSGQ